LFKPEYSQSFRCIGPACEDSCCEQWTVHVDQSTFEKFQSLPAGPLRTLIDENVLRSPEPENAPGGAALAFAQIRMADDAKCPLLSTEGLCRVQQEYGESHLPHMCATYPRAFYSVQGETEKALALSCPEAARLVLLDPHLSLNATQGCESPEGVVVTSGNDPWQPHFWPVRDFALTLVRNRDLPLWQRLFLLHLLSSRVDAIAPGDLNEKVPALLSGFTTAIRSGSLLPGMQALTVDHSKQLDVVLRLAGMLLKRSNLRPRFIECIQAFTQGIGNGPSTTFETLTARYVGAYDRYFAPFFLRHPHILENYLINTIFRCRFPFGSEWARNGTVPSMSRESALLIAQFALMKGLLIGVSGFHREEFSTDHVVHTVQAASKHFDHHLDFLKSAHALLVENRMDGAQGLVILARNEESMALRPTQSPIQQPMPALSGSEAIPITAPSLEAWPVASGD
jgi:lysine-N-methylase